MKSKGLRGFEEWFQECSRENRVDAFLRMSMRGSQKAVNDGDEFEDIFRQLNWMNI